jgi:hypothetical protein
MGAMDWLYEKTGAKYVGDAGQGIANAFKGKPKPKAKPKTGVTVGNNPIGTFPGMTSQAPGGWNPDSRFGNTSAIEQGDTGDVSQPAPGMDIASIISSIMGQDSGPSASEIAAAQKAKQDQYALDQYAGNISGQISSGSYKQPYTDMSAALAKYLETATGNVNTAYDAANAAAVTAQTNNPYANVTGTAATVDPGLMSLLQSQGVDTGASQANVGANREAEAQRVKAYDDMMKLMSANYGSGATQRIAEVAQGRTGTLADLTAQNSAYGSQIAAKQAAALQDLNDKLAEAASKGADVTGKRKELADKKAAEKAKPKAKPKAAPKAKAKPAPKAAPKVTPKETSKAVLKDVLKSKPKATVKTKAKVKITPKLASKIAKNTKGLK